MEITQVVMDSIPPAVSGHLLSAIPWAGYNKSHKKRIHALGSTGKGSRMKYFTVGPWTMQSYGHGSLCSPKSTYNFWLYSWPFASADSTNHGSKTVFSIHGWEYENTVLHPSVVDWTRECEIHGYDRSTVIGGPMQFKHVLFKGQFHCWELGCADPNCNYTWISAVGKLGTSNPPRCSRVNCTRWSFVIIV